MLLALVRSVADWPLTVAVAVMTVAAAVVGVGVGVFAVGVGVLLPVELPQAATSNASKRTMLIGIARLRFFISYLFLLNGSVKLGFCRHSSVDQYGEGYSGCRESSMLINRVRKVKPYFRACGV